MPKATADGRQLHPICVSKDGVACTIRARYNALGTAKEILDLSHFPKTAVLIEYGQPIKF